MEFIPDHEFAPDMVKGGGAPGAMAAAPDFVPDKEFTPDAAQAKPGFIPDSEFKPDNDKSKFETTGQKALTAAEGAAKGFLGPLAPAAELGLSKLGVPGLSAEEQTGRAEANPLISAGSEGAATAASLMTGIGEAGLVAKAATKLLPKVAANAGILAKAGSAAFKGMTEMAVLQGDDEVSKALLGHGDSTSAVAAHVASAGALGLISGGLFNVTGQAAGKLKELANFKAGGRAESFLAGMGAAANKNVEEAKKTLGDAINPKMFEDGIKFFEKGIPNQIHKVSSKVGDTVASGIGFQVGGIPGAILGPKVIGETISKIIQKPLNGLSARYSVPIINKALASGQTGKLFDLLDDASKLAKGATHINHGVESLFKSTGQQTINWDVLDRERKKLEAFVNEGGVDNEINNDLNSREPEQFAEGGMPGESSQLSPYAELYPEQNIALSAAKGRISGYLRSLKPMPGPKLAFDKTIHNHSGEASYREAMDIAIKPLSVIQKIQQGKLKPDHVKHLDSLYPELKQYLGQKMTERITQAQLKNERPSYSVRQGMSLFLGVPLNSEMTPGHIQAAQAVFQRQAMKQPMPQGKGDTNKLKGADNSWTIDQAAAKRQTSTKP